MNILNALSVNKEMEYMAKSKKEESRADDDAFKKELNKVSKNDKSIKNNKNEELNSNDADSLKDNNVSIKDESIKTEESNSPSEDSDSLEKNESNSSETDDNEEATSEEDASLTAEGFEVDSVEPVEPVDSIDFNLSSSDKVKIEDESNKNFGIQKISSKFTQLNINSIEQTPVQNVDVDVDSDINLKTVLKSIDLAKAIKEDAGSTTNNFASIIDNKTAAKESSITVDSKVLKEMTAKEASNVSAPISQQAVNKIKSSAWGQQVANRALIMSQFGPNTIEIQLDPPELGALQIRVKMGAGDQVSVNFNTQNLAVKEAIEKNMDSLKDLFDNQGIQLSDASVKDQSSGEKSKNVWNTEEDSEIKENTNGSLESQQISSKTSQGLIDLYA